MESQTRDAYVYHKLNCFPVAHWHFSHSTLHSRMQTFNVRLVIVDTERAALKEYKIEWGGPLSKQLFTTL